MHASTNNMLHIENSEIAFQILKKHFNPFAEEFWGIFLDSQLNLIKTEMIHKGTANHCMIHPRDLFRSAIYNNSTKIIIAHNHTSISILPSNSDLIVTKRFLKISKIMEIPIVDHIIFNSTCFYSFKSNNLIK